MHARSADADVRAAFGVAAAALCSVLDVKQEPVVDRLTLLGDQLAGRRLKRWRRRRSRRGSTSTGQSGGETWLVDVLLERLPGDGVLRLHAYEAALLTLSLLERLVGSMSPLRA